MAMGHFPYLNIILGDITGSFVQQIQNDGYFNPSKYNNERWALDDIGVKIKLN